MYQKYFNIPNFIYPDYLLFADKVKIMKVNNIKIYIITKFAVIN